MPRPGHSARQVPCKCHSGMSPRVWHPWGTEGRGYNISLFLHVINIGERSLIDRCCAGHKGYLGSGGARRQVKEGPRGRTQSGTQVLDSNPVSATFSLKKSKGSCLTSTVACDSDRLTKGWDVSPLLPLNLRDFPDSCGGGALVTLL